jgi:hypothetical protein
MAAPRSPLPLKHNQLLLIRPNRFLPPPGGNRPAHDAAQFRAGHCQSGDKHPLAGRSSPWRHRRISRFRPLQQVRGKQPVQLVPVPERKSRPQARLLRPPRKQGMFRKQIRLSRFGNEAQGLYLRESDHLQGSAGAHQLNFHPWRKRPITAEAFQRLPVKPVQNNAFSRNRWQNGRKLLVLFQTISPLLYHWHDGGCS